MAKRPLLPVAVCFAGGIIAADRISFSLVALFALGFALAAVVFWIERWREAALCAFLFFAGATRQTMEVEALSPLDLRNLQSSRPETVTVIGRLRETPRERVVQIRGRQAWRTRTVVEVEAIARRSGRQPAEGLVAVHAGDLLSSDFFAGRAVEITGVLKPPPGPLADGLFDYRNYLRRQGIYFELDARETNSWRVRINAPQPARPPLADRFLVWSRKTLALGLPEEDLPLRLNWAMTLDWKGALTEDASEPFLRAGTYHIFAVDGLRIGLIAAIVTAFLRVGQVPRMAAGLMVIPVLLFYAAATGWAASAIRATVMMSVILAGWALRRPGELLNSMCGAAFLILAWQPQQLFQAGFQLSFVVVGCISLLGPVFRKIEWKARDPLAPPLEKSGPEWLRAAVLYGKETLVASIVAWLGSIPLSAYYFNLFSTASVPANLLVVPLCVLCLICDLGSLLAGAVSPSVSMLFNNAAWLLMKIIAGLSRWASDCPGGAFYVAAPSLVAMSLYYLVLLMVLTGWIFKSPRRGAGLALILILSAAWGAERWESRRVVSLHILSDRGAEIAFLSPPRRSGDTLVNVGRSNTVSRLVKPFLRAHGVNRLPLVVLNHGDAAHAGGIQEFADLFNPGLVLTGPSRTRSAAFNYLRAASQSGRPQWRQIVADQEAGPWTALHPPEGFASARAENAALVLQAEFEKTRVLLLSNLGREGQRALLEREVPPRADVLVISLPPGSQPPLGSLLRVVQPELIVVVDGEPGSARHAPETWESQLREWKGRILWTHETGAVRFDFKPGRWTALSGDRTELAGGASRP